jgi:hypothetical protein
LATLIKWRVLEFLGLPAGGVLLYFGQSHTFEAIYLADCLLFWIKGALLRECTLPEMRPETYLGRI